MRRLYYGAKLIDGTGAPPVSDSMVVTDGEVIEYAGERSNDLLSAEKNSKSEIIDVSGQTIMPGLIDCHVHLCGILGKDVRDWVLEPDSQQAMVSTLEAERLIQHGVTSVGDVSRNGLELKKLIREWQYPGPTITACGRGLCRTGGYIDCNGLSEDMNNASHPWAILCDGEKEIQKAVRSLVREGADSIKIWTSSSGAQSKYDRDQDYSLREVEKAVEEAEYIGLPVFSHCESVDGTKVALQGGVQNIIHGEELDRECLDLFEEKGSLFLATLKTTVDWLDYSYDAIPIRHGIDDYPGDTLKEREYNRILGNFKKVRKRNIKIGVGSDTFCQAVTPYGETTMNEIIAMVELGGLSTMEAIVAATKTSAEALRRDEDVGTLEKGKVSDFLVMNSDPIDDIKNLNKGNISHVVQRGKTVVEHGKVRGEQYGKE